MNSESSANSTDERPAIHVRAGRRLRAALAAWHGPHGHRVMRWVFLRLLALVYLAAFASLWVQVGGLIGSNGILPVQDYLDAARKHAGEEAWRLVPSIFWLRADDAFLETVAAAGALLSLVLAAGIAEAPVLAALWVLFLSLFSVGQDFLGFQWDLLLIETGFLAFLLTPWRLRGGRGAEGQPFAVSVWLLRWLLFRLMFSSGAVKLLSGDPAWRDLTALTYHYETQPLPTFLAWYAHQLPGWLQQLSCLLMFVIELAVPLLIFGTRGFRLAACLALSALQVLILATGNYCYFNMLTLTLCVTLLDDGHLRRVLPQRLLARLDRGDPAPSEPRWKRLLVAAVACVLLALSTFPLSRLARRPPPLPSAALELLSVLEPLRLVNGYGLFAVMTKKRLEIDVQGSNDGVEWKSYPFHYKPEDPAERPRWAAPHQPRLDWQMWFAALGSYRNNPWFISFLIRLLQGSPEVLALLEADPFPDAPPRYVRAISFEYRFTRAGETGGGWWRREPAGEYCPAISLQGP